MMQLKGQRTFVTTGTVLVQKRVLIFLYRVPRAPPAKMLTPRKNNHHLVSKDSNLFLEADSHPSP